MSQDERLMAVGAVAAVATALGVVASRRRRAADDAATTLIELWAAVADLLSAYQDAVADEAYLGTGCL